MAIFIKETEINLVLEDLINDAEELLVLFCPYFKLHDRLRDCLKRRKEDYNLRIIIVFGKNEDDPSKSLHKEDYEFLKSFPYIDIAYEKRLHAKYYSNEKSAIITSLNLHTYSHNNNIEVGVLFNRKKILKNLSDKILGRLTSMISETEDLAIQAHSFFIDIYKNSEKVFQKEPQFKNGFLKINKSFTHSEVLVDKSDWFYDQIKQKEYPRNPIGFNVNQKNQSSEIGKGYCIRTKEKIAFDPFKPFSWNAYQEWSGNLDFKEHFCHSCGKKYNTSFRKPLCDYCAESKML